MNDLISMLSGALGADLDTTRYLHVGNAFGKRSLFLYRPQDKRPFVVVRIPHTDEGIRRCEAELAGQWGRWAGDTVLAWSLSIDGGFTFKEGAWSPRLGAGFDWASGDRDPTDGVVQTFDQLFPLGHKYFGFIDLLGRKNVTAANVNLTRATHPSSLSSCPYLSQSTA